MKDEQNIPEEQPMDYRSQSADESKTGEDNIQPLTGSPPEVLIQKPEIKNMEVHHPHHPTHKKKWTEYLLEFLMLFLAVFLGFVAENIREHAVEANRAKEFASLLLTDLKNDSAYVSQISITQNFKIKQADSLLTLLNTDTFTNNNYRVVHHFNYVGTLIDFKPAFPVNFEQIKNSGSIRYYKNKKLVSELSFLNRHMETTKEVYDSHNQFILQQLTPFSIQHFNTQQFDVLSRRVLVPVPDIYDWNKKEAIILANKLSLVKAYDLFLTGHFLKITQQKINELIRLISNEYHFE